MDDKQRVHCDECHSWIRPSDVPLHKRGHDKKKGGLSALGHPMKRNGPTLKTSYYPVDGGLPSLGRKH